MGQCNSLGAAGLERFRAHQRDRHPVLVEVAERIKPLLPEAN